MRDHHAKSSAMACAVALATTLSLLAGCGPSKPSAEPGRETPARKAPPDPQAVLDAATKRMKDEGTGSYVIELPEVNTITKGKFDLDKKVTSEAMSSHLPHPELPNGFTVRGLMFKDEAFVRISIGPARKCWMRFEASDFTDAPGGTKSISPSDFASMTSPPPAAEILEKPKARGFVKSSTTEIKADVPLWPTFAAAMPGAADVLADKIKKKRKARITLTVDDGAYSGATYSVGDVLRAAHLRPRDLKKAGISEPGMAPKQAFELLASTRVDITYGAFGQKVDVSRPPKDRIADVDLATISATGVFTCKAAER